MVMKRANANQETHALLYESPQSAFVEVKVEGVLCVSGKNDDEYEEVTFEW